MTVEVVAPDVESARSAATWTRSRVTRPKILFVRFAAGSGSRATTRTSCTSSSTSTATTWTTSSSTSATSSPGCGFDNDGSRNWFFERDADEPIFEAGISCAPEAQWNHLLGEVYAEDYTWLNGNRSWRSDMPLGAPTDRHLDALAGDLAAPFETRARRYERWVDHGRSRVHPSAAARLDIAHGPLRGRPAADLDLYLYTSGADLPFAGSARPRSREELQGALPPGSYKLEIFAHSKSGRGTLALFLE